ncbi:uncharacterized protein LOC134684787 [Mytilus trossulus]|uniref:uncharacterized protein LOC134684787 n=1 Tax=Mytilus trossulus TaxID=6551 RepID=UPI0030066198
MAAKYCEPCTARGMTPTASKWCTECEEALCSDCTEAHRVQKMSRNHHLLEALEESLLKQLAEKKDNYVTSLKRQDKSIKELLNSTKAQKESLEFIRDHSSEKQAFVSIRSSKPILNEIENKVKQLVESFADISLTFIESGSKEKLADFGSIEIKETPCSVPFVPYKQRQSQIPVGLKRQITSFTYIYDIDMRGEQLRSVTGITISDNNTLIFCDVSMKKIHFCDENDSYQSSIRSPYKPYDISAIPGTMTAVVSSRFEPYIQYLDIKRRRISKKREVEQSDYFGIDATKDNIFVGPKANIQALDLCGNIQRTVKSEYGQGSSGYISVCPNGNICYSSGNAVHCITLDECHVFSYRSLDLLYPRNMIIDDAGNIYILDCDSQNIHKLTPTGIFVGTISTARFSNPYTFCFSKDMSKCYMANRRGTTISVFKTN